MHSYLQGLERRGLQFREARVEAGRSLLTPSLAECEPTGPRETGNDRRPQSITMSFLDRFTWPFTHGIKINSKYVTYENQNLSSSFSGEEANILISSHPLGNTERKLHSSER